MNEAPGITVERARALLEDLVAIDSINPMDGAPRHPGRVEAGVNDYLTDVLRPFDVAVTREAVSDLHENLYVDLAGATGGPAMLFEAHADTVPADDWADRALLPRRDGDRVIGRGAADTKGSLVSMLLAVLDLAERGITPPRSVTFMSAGDEEFAQTGIKHFRTTGREVGWGIFGEPSNLIPIVQHKGTIRWDITANGKSAHSSQPHLGVDAIAAAIDVIEGLRKHQSDLADRYRSDLMTSPTLTVTRITGGRTRNAVADQCTVSLDYRVVPGQDPDVARAEVLAALEGLALDLEHGDVQLMTPPLATDPGDPFAQVVQESCRVHGHRDAALAGVPYGTDASWVSDRAPALVLGPGSIDVAHAIDEAVDVNEVVACALIYSDLMTRPSLELR